MNQDRLLSLLVESVTLKRLPRTGWVLRGIPDVESVAEHSFGVVFMSLVLVDVLGSEQSGGSGQPAVDLEKVLVMAVLHDLAEVRLTDLPTSATRLIPGEVKRQAETEAVEDLLAPLPGAIRWRELWRELTDESSPEGQLVRDADKLEMMVQCLRYEQAGQQGLDEFWMAMDGRRWHYPLCAELYARLRALRPGMSRGECSET